MNPKEFKALREQHNLTKVQLSEFLQITTMSIYRYETGKRAIPHAIAICMRSLPIQFKPSLKKDLTNT